jgi:phosphoglycolate phosphatase
MTKVLIFDFDGTIADTMAFASEIANDILPLYGRPQGLSQEDIKQLRNMSIPNGLKYLKIPPHKLPKLAITAKQELTNRLDELKPVSGMVEALKKLHEQGIEMGIVSSNSPKNVLDFLRKYDLRSYFTFVEAGASIFGKSRHIKSAIKKQRLDKDDCVYVGDEIRDVEASNSIKIPCISVAWGFNAKSALERINPGKVIEHPKDLPGRL